MWSRLRVRAKLCCNCCIVDGPDQEGIANRVVWPTPKNAHSPLKVLITSIPILHLHEHIKVFALKAYSSEVGIGALLMKKNGSPYL